VLESLADLRIIRPASVWTGPQPGKKPAPLASRWRVCPWPRRHQSRRKQRISMVDGANGRLVYQGYVIADLAENMSFEEGRIPASGRVGLPTRAELDALTLELAGSRALTQAARSHWTPSQRHRPDGRCCGASSRCRESSNRLPEAERPARHPRTASFPTILAMFHRPPDGDSRGQTRADLAHGGQLPLHAQRQGVEAQSSCTR